MCLLVPSTMKLYETFASSRHRIQYKYMGLKHILSSHTYKCFNFYSNKKKKYKNPLMIRTYQFIIYVTFF